jgi:hypothetical protein
MGQSGMAAVADRHEIAIPAKNPAGGRKPPPPRETQFSQNPSLTVTIGLTLSIPREEVWSWSCIALNSLKDLGCSPRRD